jgi:peptidoglycan/xylan/chitin deacetylase (PgdA/CDA1 family)
MLDVTTPRAAALRSSSIMKRRASGWRGAAVAGLSGGPALLDRREDRQVREDGASAVPAAPGQRLEQLRLIWSVPTAEPLAALTFDNGLDPELTPRILEVLAEHGVQATFNVMGWNALQHPDLVRAVVAAGHELGNHTWTHQDLAFQSALQTRHLEWGREAIERTGGVRPRFFRPPRGNLTGSAIEATAELGCDVRCGR